MIKADPYRLRQVFLNLTINAIESTNSSGKITVRTDSVKQGDKEKNWLLVDVIDEGIGIPSKHMNRIFDPFFTTKSSGTGLGLTVTHKIIEDHNGMIEVESLEDKGTKFTILLPVAKLE